MAQPVWGSKKKEIHNSSLRQIILGMQEAIRSKTYPINSMLKFKLQASLLIVLLHYNAL